MRDSLRRPSLENDQSFLLKTIADIALSGIAADDGRQTEFFRSVKILDELAQELHKIGFGITWSGVYLRPLPGKYNLTEGRRHVSKVPVKLTRAQTDHHNNHLVSRSAETSIHQLENIASILGPDQVFLYLKMMELVSLLVHQRQMNNAHGI